ncbi:mitochondrial carrier domain-containing protein [Lasiosphaeris hirsuta]|uniref:Mitochondrial carrier domain-containing protein n=1 Tax=Lasiosphaeris hirsuta TaxID=260670 RepID=A0AA40DPN6_9PEZI|nr:mitochondrial carrier domain-containing protein [Lasiosphaeris hirsuta]
MPHASKLLPSLGHAASGAGATVISSFLFYPLDLVNTRLKVQRQLRADGTIGPDDSYGGILDAFAIIYAKEGGRLSAYFAGLGPGLAKSAADSFLFFLFYTWFRARRLRAHNDLPYLSVLEELAVGAAAGACAKAFTTPVSNVVTRRQTASLLEMNDSNNPGKQNTSDKSFGEIVAEMRREKGLLGLWAGYSASLVLTLNPSMTFFLQQMLKRALVAREDWDEPGSPATFLLAAVSKVVATTVTYPFQIAKARGKEGSSSALAAGVRGVARDTIFATVFRIAKAEGVAALYDGVGGELLKGFFSHGTTMLFKDVIHRFLVRLYFAILAALQKYPELRARVNERIRRARSSARQASQQAYFLSVSEVYRGTRYIKSRYFAGEKGIGEYAEQRIEDKMA